MTLVRVAVLKYSPLSRVGMCSSCIQCSHSASCASSKCVVTLNKNIGYEIMSKPVYGCKTFGILMPSGVWQFSKIPANTLGKAKALPFRVCAKTLFPVASLKRSFKRLAWKVSKLDTEDISNHLSWAVENNSKSKVKAEVKPRSPPHSLSILYG